MSKLILPGDVRCAGRYEARIVRAGRVIDAFAFDNIVVTEGLNQVLGSALGGASAITTWYLGLYEGNYTPIASDTAATIAANAVETSAYAGGVRPTWTPAAAASGSITNAASRATFTFNADKTIYGALMISSQVIGGTAGKLLSAARFPTQKIVANGDQLLMTYTFNATSA